MATRVIQSHRSPLPYPWIAKCLQSVESWASQHGFDYQFIGDELFNFLPDDIIARDDISAVIKSDLARLRYAQHVLQQCQRVVWLDADVLVFNPIAFELPASSCLVGRENWPQVTTHGKLKNYRKVHNAAMVFDREDTFLPLYADTAERFLRENTSALPPQFIGPKLLTALHNVIQLQVWEEVGMLSPAVANDMLGLGKGAALTMLRDIQPEMSAINLCGSSALSGELTTSNFETIIATLLRQKRV